MIYLGQPERFYGENCWSWGGLDICTTTGGFWVSDVKRSTTIQDDRKRLGIVVKEVKKVIKKAIKKTIKESNDEKALQVFEADLKKLDIQIKPNYQDAFLAYRDRMIMSDIARKLQEQSDQDEEDSIFLLL